MKILWITNILLPDVCKKIGVLPSVFGGWMHSSLKVLNKRDTIIGVASLYDGKFIQEHEINSVHYFLIPKPKNNNRYNIFLEKYWEDIIDKFKPDLIHLHGTEAAHGLALINACPDTKIVVSIQGLVSVYSNYYFANISYKDILLNTSLKDIIFNDSLFYQRKRMRKRGDIERNIIMKVDHVIGRTDWDYSHSMAINNKLIYHFCNETLRSSFYNKEWDYANCEKYSIFISQAGYPLKGLHQVLKAISLIQMKYPFIKLYVAGYNPTKYRTLKDRLLISTYGNYLRKLIKKFQLQNNIIFLGFLNESDMVQRNLNSNLFICPSSIENSPNSLGEAQILGVPCIGSYVGGIPNMIEDGETGFLYRFEEIEMLARLIDKIFSMKENELKILSHKERVAASKRHDPLINAKRLTEIYEQIINNK